MSIASSLSLKLTFVLFKAHPIQPIKLSAKSDQWLVGAIAQAVPDNKED
jgi:hypothetical protein